MRLAAGLTRGRAGTQAVAGGAGLGADDIADQYTPRDDESDRASDQGDNMQFDGSMAAGSRPRHQTVATATTAQARAGRAQEALGRALGRDKTPNAGMYATAVFDEFLQAFIITRGS